MIRRLSIGVGCHWVELGKVSPAHLVLLLLLLSCCCLVTVNFLSESSLLVSNQGSPGRGGRVSAECVVLRGLGLS